MTIPLPSAYSEEPGMLRLSLTIAATFLLVACASCGDNASETIPVHSPSVTSTTTPPTSEPPTTTTTPIPPYLASYTRAQRAAYRQAVAAYDAFATKNSRLLAAGTTTPAALAFYRHFSTDWSTAWANLGQLSQNHVTVTGTTTVKRVRPGSITLDPATTTVVEIKSCLDETHLRVTQNGTVLDQPNLRAPHIYRVRLEHRHGESWWRSAAAEQGSKC